MKTLVRLLLLITISCTIFIFGETLQTYAAKSGECGAQGDNVTWTLNDHGVLYIHGTGEMKNYDSDSPWFKEGLNNAIFEVIISPGVTSVGDFSFSSFIRMEKVTLPEGLKKIGRAAFISCITSAKASI